ncbi:MAG: ribosome biogenesis GTP-binding protein YihA/YsxC [Candidatus Paceibacterota bacterium]|jgi:GTP-binding protein|nr:ribosome biogenesis GTP-binding protein YihA/YsxC [Candidatus Paceibacterota bacterium]
MKITSASFVKGIRGTDALLSDPKLEFAFVGRSNVGKSSVINALLGRKGLAKSSSSPGKTKEINFFLVNDEFYFVDLPGYGYARAPDGDKEKLVKHIMWYLFESDAPIALVLVLIDAHIGPTERDFEMISALTEGKIPFVVLGNKFDRINKTARPKALKDILTQIGHVPFIPFSAEKKEGVSEALKKIEEAILTRSGNVFKEGETL